VFARRRRAAFTDRFVSASSRPKRAWRSILTDVHGGRLRVVGQNSATVLLRWIGGASLHDSRKHQGTKRLEGYLLNFKEKWTLGMGNNSFRNLPTVQFEEHQTRELRAKVFFAWGSRKRRSSFGDLRGDGEGPHAPRR